MRLTKNLGMLLLGIWLLIQGLEALVGLGFRGLGTIGATLALVGGILIILGRLLAGAVGVYLWRQGTKGGSLAFVGLVSGLIVLGMAAAATLRDARAAHWASTPGAVGWGALSCHAAIAPHTPYRGPEPPTTLCF